jgi:hypothetical protein
LRAMIQYHIMIQFPSLVSLIGASRWIFANVACMILLMILPLASLSDNDGDPARNQWWSYGFEIGDTTLCTG